MSTIVVLSWTDHEARIVVASAGIGGPSIRDVASIALPDGSSPAAVAKALRPHVATHTGGKPTIIVLAGGSDVQYRLLDLPPAPRDDLIDMVRMQAESGFASSDDGSLIDFTQLAGSEDLPVQVLLSRLSSRAVRDINETMAQLQLTATHIVPVGVAVAWFAESSATALTTGNHLLIVPDRQSLDLTVVHDGKLTLGRRVTFSSPDDLARPEKLLTPIRRTLAAAAGELPGEAITSICWLGDADIRIENDLWTTIGVPVTSLDVSVLARSAGVNAGSTDLAPYALHVGALASASDFAIDFLHPKQRSIPPSRKRMWVLAGTAAAVMVLAVAGSAYRNLAQMDAEARQLIDDRNKVVKEVDRLAPQVTRAAAIAQWQATDINWLDELATLSERIRPLKLNAKEFDAATDVRVEQLTLKRKAGATAVGGDVDMSAAARQMATIETLEARLRDDEHPVVPSAVNTDAEKAPYEWTFKVQIGVPASGPGEGA